MKMKLSNTTYFIITILLCGFIFGIYLSNYIQGNDLVNLNNSISTIATGTNQFEYLKSELVLGICLIIIIVLFATSFICTPLIGGIIFIKGVQIGYTCMLYLFTYQFKGIIGIILTLLPQIILDIAVIYIISTIGIKLSLDVFKSVFYDIKVNIKYQINELVNKIFICFILTIASALIKSYVVVELIKWFTKL